MHAGARNQKIRPIVRWVYLTKNLVHIVIWPNYLIITFPPGCLDWHRITHSFRQGRFRLHNLFERPTECSRFSVGVAGAKGQVLWGGKSCTVWCMQCQNPYQNVLAVIPSPFASTRARNTRDECTGKFCKLRSGPVLKVLRRLPRCSITPWFCRLPS